MLSSHGSRRSTRHSTYVCTLTSALFGVSHWMRATDPAVYPHSMSSESIYPVSQVNDKAARSMYQASGYPDFNICARFCDISEHWLLTYLSIDPSVRKSDVMSPVRDASASTVRRSEVRVKLASQYPVFDLCMYSFSALRIMTYAGVVDPAVYPHNLGSIYSAHGSVSPISSSVYPIPAICKLPCVTVASETERYADPVTYKRTAESPRSSAPRAVSSTLASGINVAFDACYPHFKLCRYSTGSEQHLTHFVIDPAVYPHNLAKIYPTVGSASAARAVNVSLSVVYPHFNLCEFLRPWQRFLFLKRTQIQLFTRTICNSSIPQFCVRLLSRSRLTRIHMVWSLCPASTHAHVSYICHWPTHLTNSALSDTAVDPFLMLHPELADGYSPAGPAVRHKLDVKAARYPVLDICA